MIEFDDHENKKCFDIENRKMIFIVSITSIFEINHVVCHRTQFSLKFAFVITIHKSQKLTLLKIVIYLQVKDVHTTNVYVILFKIRKICDFVIEKFVFRDVFSKLISIKVLKRLNDDFRRQNRFDKIIFLFFKKKSNEKKQFAISKKINNFFSSTVSSFVIDFEIHECSFYVDDDSFTNSSSFYTLANDEISNQSFVISNDNMNASSLLNLMTLIDVVFMLFSKRFRLNIQCNVWNRDFFFVYFLQRNEIVEIIDQFSFNRVVNDVDNQNFHMMKRFWHDFRFWIDLNALFSFLKIEWFHSFSILVAINALTKSIFNVQLLNSNLFRYVRAIIFEQFENVEFIDIFSIFIIVIVFVNVLQHWLFLFVIRQNTSLSVITCNSLFDMKKSSFSRFLKMCVEVLQKKSNYFEDAIFDDQFRSMINVKQINNHNCDVYVIVNVIDLFEKRQFSLNRVFSRELRLDYARATIRHHELKI